MSATNRAVFLDRDGVLIEDVDLLRTTGEVVILPGVPQALEKLRAAGFLLLVVTNQTIVSRGLADLQQVETVNAHINHQLNGLITGFYICPHHPHANREEYRMECSCRKPNPGMLLQGASDFAVELRKSWMVGDRISDIIAGIRAGCRTIRVATGAHVQPPIISAAMPQNLPEPDYDCSDLTAAADIILNRSAG